MNGKRWLVTSVVVLSLLAFTSTALAIGDDKHSRPSLKRLKKLVVVVQIERPLAEEFKKVGLTEERIQMAIELKLKEAKLDVIYADTLPSDTPILHVEVNGSKKNDNTFSFLIEVQLWQKSFLKRDPKIEVMAATWSAGVFGLGSASTIANDIMGLIKDLMDSFAKAYISANS